MINRFKWLEIKPDTRKNIVLYLKDFTDFPEFKKTGTVEVAGNKVVCDGFTDKDLCNLTPELLKAALDEKTLEARGVDSNDIYSLFYELVARLEMKPVELKEQPVAKVEEITHEVTVEEIKDNNLEEVLAPGDEIKIPIKKVAKKSNKTLKK